MPLPSSLGRSFDLIWLFFDLAAGVVLVSPRYATLTSQLFSGWSFCIGNFWRLILRREEITRPNIECLQIFMNHHCSVFNTFKISSIYSLLFWGTWQGGTVLVAWGLSSMADKGGLVILLAWSLQVGGVKKKHRKKGENDHKRTKEGTIWVGCNVFFVSLKVYEKDNRRF